MPRFIPPVWEGKDWDSVCPTCTMPLFLVAEAERRLPAGDINVMRCSGCMRALWWQSAASAVGLLEYAIRVTRHDEANNVRRTMKPNTRYRFVRKPVTPDEES